MNPDEPCALRQYPAKLSVEITTRCNLACPMCLKNTCGDLFLEADMEERTFQALLPALKTAEVLVLNGIGEPLIHPRLDDFICLARSHMPQEGWIGFQSNGFLLDEKRALGLIGAGLDRICISIDAVDPEGFRLIRKGGELSGIQSALTALRRARMQCRSPFLIGIEFVLRKDNLEELPKTIAWAGEHGVDFALVSQLFPYHPDLVSQALYDANLDASVAIYNEFRSRAAQEGLDLRTYRNAYMHYTTSPQDMRVKELVESMLGKALSSNVSMNLQRLFDMDDSWQEKTARIFEEARSTASVTGIDLRLPGIVPRSMRRCEFVEEGCAFVSVDGGLHPCYYLWHRYRCYIGGIEKAVAPKCFGRLSERGILEIWNEQAYRTFRRNVLRYDYPFCFNCSFALCDYVQGEDFEQDCYINAETCAVCLWCMVIFQCLK